VIALLLAYALNERAPSPGAVHVARALRLATRAAWVCVAAVTFATWMKAAWA
jgi:hypothetical protein